MTHPSAVTMLVPSANVRQSFNALLLWTLNDAKYKA
jgi:hypothetical protein